MRSARFRGLNKSGTWHYGSLVIADTFVRHMPKQPSRTWIVTSAFGNGGWFNIQCKHWVSSTTVGQFTGLKDNQGTDTYFDDTIYIAGYGVLELTTVDDLAVLYKASYGNHIGQVTGNLHNQHKGTP